MTNTKQMEADKLILRTSRWMRKYNFFIRRHMAETRNPSKGLEALLDPELAAGIKYTRIIVLPNGIKQVWYLAEDGDLTGCNYIGDDNFPRIGEVITTNNQTMY